MTKREMFIKTHPAIGLKVPVNLNRLPALRASSKFVAPTVVNSMGLCTITEDQGSTSKCAAYATTSFAENILWRKTHCPQQLDPDAVYAAAKKIDGDNSDGTTLNSAMKGFLKVYPDLFDKDCKCKIITSCGGDVDNIKFALHKYGVMVGGFNITTDWYNCDKTCKGWIPSTDKAKSAGGHAVLVCGYNRSGLQIQNSWGESFGDYGFATLAWPDVVTQFLYGAVLVGCLRHLDD